MEKLKNILFTVFASKRAKSFYWRFGLASALLFTGYLTEILPDLNLGEGVAIFIAYVLNEVTKFLNKKKDEPTDPE
jgi:hypothetical protein